ncbi:MAG: hypothetical protein ACOCRO_05030 [Halanaerobiales bacterium]
MIILDETIYSLIYKFEEDHVNEFELLDEEKKYVINEMGYGNFLEMKFFRNSLIPNYTWRRTGCAC